MERISLKDAELFRHNLVQLFKSANHLRRGNLLSDENVSRLAEQRKWKHHLLEKLGQIAFERIDLEPAEYEQTIALARAVHQNLLEIICSIQNETQSL